MRAHVTTLLLAAVFCFPVVAGAEMYTWKDAEGRTHFGDKPPPEAREQAEEIEAKAYKPGSDEKTREVYQRTNRMFDAKDKIQREAQQEQDQRAAHNEEARKAGCREARDRARQLNGPVLFVDDEGNPVKATDADRKQKLQETQDWIAQNCR
ncbi:MAG: DUF4124 domain-containing protein [Gammaproteobacteria bacterium]